ncbi:hypothetical protein LY01_02155 [Nonlabens xylanidelens]|uniref:Uncharacterized protein n=1 Tax=Nonlabens xylanidelens TaxID=191564 RepID=A0A2S6II88_9FLAO|nr:DUF6236 family protein [Nonlabens xylanidelens]PPK93933.1 hypothetical protein LY01_02155 [Nonlabens xylanidelens]PQJ22089.1 hypothetical protein BST94_00490 [Nonlabens xylanidelens]
MDNKVKYISHKFNEDYNDVKALALYFDRIDIVEQPYIHSVEDENSQIIEKIDSLGKKKFYKQNSIIKSGDFLSDEFKTHLKPLEDENLIEYSIDFGELINIPTKYYKVNRKPFVPVQKSKLIYGDDKKILPKNPNEQVYFINNDALNTQINSLTSSNIFSSEISYLKKEILKQRAFHNLILNSPHLRRTATSNTFEDIKSTYKDDLFEVKEYLGKLIQSYIDANSLGHSTITTSNIMNEIIFNTSQDAHFLKVKNEFQNQFQVNPFLVHQAIKIGIPNLSNIPTHEILEFRNKSKDELKEFKLTLEEITLNLLSNYDSEFISLNAQKIVELKVKPLIENLSEKLGDTKLTVAKSLITEIRDPRSYSPLLLTLSNDISNTLIYLVSIGIISFNTAFEYYSNNKKNKKDGIYYLLKAKKYFE